MNEPLTELAVYFHGETEPPDQERAWLTTAARAGGSRWDDIAAACGIATHGDLAGRDYWLTGETCAELLFSATQTAVGRLTGSESYFPPLTWACEYCGQQVTDCVASGRPAHIEHGHTPHCAGLTRDQAADAQRRRARRVRRRPPKPDVQARCRPARTRSSAAAQLDHLLAAIPRRGARGAFESAVARDAARCGQDRQTPGTLVPHPFQEQLWLTSFTPGHSSPQIAACQAIAQKKLFRGNCPAARA